MFWNKKVYKVESLDGDELAQILLTEVISVYKAPIRGPFGDVRSYKFVVQYRHNSDDFSVSYSNAEDRDEAYDKFVKAWRKVL